MVVGCVVVVGSAVDVECVVVVNGCVVAAVGGAVVVDCAVVVVACVVVASVV